MAYAYYISLQVDHTKVGGSNSTDFTHCIKIVGDTKIKTVANGGQVQNTTGGGLPCDLVFSTDTAGASLLGGWEIEQYDAVNGNLIAWLKRTTNSSSDDQIYMCVGDAAVNTYQGGSTGAAYDSNFKAAYNFTQSITADSTSNANNLTNNSASLTTGMIGDGATFTGGNNRYLALPTITLSGDFTISGWATFTGSGTYVLFGASATTNAWLGSSTTNAHIDAFAGMTANGGSISSGYHRFDIVRSGSSAEFLLDNSSVTTATNSSDVTGGGYHLGNFKVADVFAWQGVADVWRISNSFRAAAWRTAEYNNQSAPTAAESTSNAWWIAGAWTAPSSGQPYIKRVGGVLHMGRQIGSGIRQW